MGRNILSRRSVLKLLGAGTAAAAAGSSPAAAGDAGRPTGGDDAYWTTGQQYGVGTVADHGSDDPSRVWFTLSEGAMTGARFPRIDLMHLRTLEFVVADAADDADYAVRTYNASRRDDDASSVERRTRPVDSDALLFEQQVRDEGGGRDWRLDVEYVAHPDHDAVLLDVAFEADDGRAYDVYALADPSLSNSGLSDEARVEPYRASPRQSDGRAADGTETEAYALTGWDAGENDGEAVVRAPDGDPYNVAAALVSDVGFGRATVDVAGGDALSSLLSSGDVPTAHDRAAGNVAMVGRVASGRRRASDTLALGFAAADQNGGAKAAFETAREALRDPYDRTRGRYVKSWRDYLDGVDAPESVRLRYERWRQYRMAAMVLRAADSKQFPGAGIASPSVPWGEAVKANSPSDYGYNYVWSRDLYQAATAMEAMGDVESATRAVEYLYEYQQRDDGFLPQNTYVDGRTRWGGEQMDNISFPQLVAYQLWERHGVGFDEASYGYDNVRKSADYVVANGPETGQERWEEESGLSPSTTAAEVAGLAGAAELAAAEGERGDALAYLGVADRWQARTEEWMATETGTTDHENTPYYVRVNDDRDPDDGATVTLNNGGPTLDERSVIDAGFLELVRLGVKPWDDPVVRNSLREVDDTIRVETPHGPAWYRYNGDGYGEQAENPDDDYDEGAPWSLDNAGKGRLWPIFSGERGEYELLAGTDRQSATAPDELLDAMVGFANSGLMIPEQVWDQEDATAFEWEFGEGTGSATPLSWSMAQFVRLAHSLDVGRPVERPAVTTRRYVKGSPPAGPSLDVTFPDAVVEDATVTVSGTTDGDEVVAKSPAETVHRRVETEDGSFELELGVADGGSTLTVAAGRGGDDLPSVGTTVRRREVTHVGVGDELASWTDPAGDDAGPGSYVYPAADVYVDGAFDFAEFGVYETDGRYQFLARIAGPLTNPWGGDPISLQSFQFYLRDSGSGGATAAREGVHATFEAPYRRRVFVEGFVQPRVEAADGSVVSRDVSVTACPEVSAVKVSVPKSAVGSFDRVSPLLLGQDGYSPGRVRPVEADVGAHAFGGGRDDSMDPNVIDVVTPDGVSNADALAYSAEDRATIPYLSL